MASRDELAAIAVQWVSLWSVPVDWELFERLHAPAFVDESSAGRPSTREGFGQGLAAFARAFPDVRTVADDLVVDVERSRVAVRWTATGTNAGRYLGAGPTHAVTRITGIEIIEVAAGRIVRRWGEWDVTAHLAAGGASPEG